MAKLQTSRPTIIAAMAVAAVLLAACSSNGDAASTAPASQASGQQGASVAVALREWSVEPSAAETSPGEITFEVSNDGALPHNFVVFATDLAPDQLPVENAQVVESDAVEEVGRIDEFPGESSENLTLQLDAGAYVLVCNLPGHYEQGMRAAFSVAD